jgi:hypothetical protein
LGQTAEGGGDGVEEAVDGCQGDDQYRGVIRMYSAIDTPSWRDRNAAACTRQISRSNWVATVW